MIEINLSLYLYIINICKNFLLIISLNLICFMFLYASIDKASHCYVKNTSLVSFRFLSKPQ